MTIHFAEAVNASLPSRLTRIQARLARGRPANDNDPSGGQDAMLHAALRQFAQHGVAAAEHARQQAERAFFKGDRDTYQWWLEICRTLDRRIASGAIRSLDGEASINPR